VQASPGDGSGRRRALDGAALVHGRITVGGLVERQVEVEDLATIDRAVADQLYAMATPT
jgi:hypothetical protein